MPKANFQTERKCLICGKLFLAKNVDSVYCSRKCSNIAYRNKKRAEKREARLNQIADSVPDSREFIKISEAVAMYGVSRDTLYRLIRKGEIQAINLGTRLTRILRSSLDARFEHRKEALTKSGKPLPKMYSLEPEDCYTIGEISKKYRCSESTVYSTIRKSSIPTRQIGRFVYAPKSDIDAIFKSTKK